MTKFRFATFLALMCVCFMTSSVAYGNVITMNFDSIVLPSGGEVDATAYLASYGITFTPNTPATLPAIQNPATVAHPTSGSNLFTLYGATGPQDISFTLDFSSLISDFSFTRVSVDSNAAIAAWNATAFDSMGNQVGQSVSEPFMFGSAPLIFTIDGTGIEKVIFTADNATDRTTFNFPPLDDVQFVQNAPEPGSLALLGIGLAGLAVVSRRRVA